MSTTTHDLRPCPGCERMTSDRTEWRYRYPGELEAGEWALASQTEVVFGFWRCGACLGKATRAWRQLGRPVGSTRA